MRHANPDQDFVLLFGQKCTLPKCDTNDADLCRASFFSRVYNSLIASAGTSPGSIT